MTDTGKPLNAPVTLSLNLKLFGTAYPLLNVCRVSSAVDVVSGPNTWTFLFIKQQIMLTCFNCAISLEIHILYWNFLCTGAISGVWKDNVPSHWQRSCQTPTASPFTFFGIWMLSFNALGQGWLPFATVISKAVLVHLDNVVLSIKSLAQTSLTQCCTLFAT